MESIDRANAIIDALDRAVPYTPESIRRVRLQIQELTQWPNAPRADSDSSIQKGDGA